MGHCTRKWPQETLPISIFGFIQCSATSCAVAARRGELQGSRAALESAHARAAARARLDSAAIKHQADQLVRAVHATLGTLCCAPRDRGLVVRRGPLELWDQKRGAWLPGRYALTQAGWLHRLPCDEHGGREAAVPRDALGSLAGRLPVASISLARCAFVPGTGRSGLAGVHSPREKLMDG